jgi:tRNA(fMet)-specific endonuclease VapC
VYLLDTNILSELVKKRPNPHLLSRLSAQPAQDLFTSIICIMELRYGSALRDDFQLFWEKLVDRVVSQIQVVPLGLKEGLLAGDLLASLRKKGQIIGLEDVLIAASALSRDFILVSANVRHFLKVDGLVCENWLRP